MRYHIVSAMSGGIVHRTSSLDEAEEFLRRYHGGASILEVPITGVVPCQCGLAFNPHDGDGHASLADLKQ